MSNEGYADMQPMEDEDDLVWRECLLYATDIVCCMRHALKI